MVAADTPANETVSRDETAESAVGEDAVEQAGPAGAEDTKDCATVYGAELVQARAHRERESGRLHDRHASGVSMQGSSSRRKLLWKCSFLICGS